MTVAEETFAFALFFIFYYSHICFFATMILKVH